MELFGSHTPLAARPKGQRHTASGSGLSRDIIAPDSRCRGSRTHALPALFHASPAVENPPAHVFPRRHALIMNSAPKCVKPGCQRPKRVSPEERRRRPETRESRPACGGAPPGPPSSRPATTPTSTTWASHWKGWCWRRPGRPRGGADPLHTGNAAMACLSGDLQLRTGEFHPQARPGPFPGRPRAPTGVFLEVAPGGIHPPQAAPGLPVLPPLDLEPGHRLTVQGDGPALDQADIQSLPLSHRLPVGLGGEL